MGKATCKTCQKVISCRGRNTWVMRRHMEVQHEVKFPWAVGQKNKSKSINTAISTKVNNHGRTTECQSCGRSFSSLAQHLRQRCDDFTSFFLVKKYFNNISYEYYVDFTSFFFNSMECQINSDSTNIAQMSATSNSLEDDFEFVKPQVQIKEEYPDDLEYNTVSDK